MTILKDPSTYKVYSKQVPFISKITERYVLNKEGSTKQTYHISLSLQGFEGKFSPGDALVVLPENPPELVEEILQTLGFDPLTPIKDPKSMQMMSIQDFLQHKANLSNVSAKFSKYLNIDHSRDLDVMQTIKISSASITPQNFCDHLMPLMPRFYSIASAQSVMSNEVHLLIVTFTHFHGGRWQKGIGSSYLCETAQIGKTPIKMYIQPNAHFAIPEDPQKDIIMIGPGTGIAPYKAFLQERTYTKAKGKNWLFFGERLRCADFYYEDYLCELVEQNLLKLNTAFSRDQEKKHYVQHEMLQSGEELWQWIKNGSYLFVCGDAKHMAKDVHQTLIAIAMQYGNLNEKEAKEYFKEMRKQRRYVADVY